MVMNVIIINIIADRCFPQYLVEGLVSCYARVVGSTGDVYWRVHGSPGGWLFETRDGKRTLERVGRALTALDTSTTTSASAAITLSGARDLARRLGAEEILYNENSRVVSFKKDGTRINVYYTTGTVGTCLIHPVQVNNYDNIATTMHAYHQTDVFVRDKNNINRRFGQLSRVML